MPASRSLFSHFLQGFPKVNCQLYSVSTFEKSTMSKVNCQLLRYLYSSKVNSDWSRTFSTVLEYSRRLEKVRDCEGSLTTMNFCEGSLIRGQSVNPRSANKNKVRGFTHGAEYLRGVTEYICVGSLIRGQSVNPGDPRTKKL